MAKRFRIMSCSCSCGFNSDEYGANSYKDHDLLA